MKIYFGMLKKIYERGVNKWKKSIERVKEYLKNFEGDKKDFEAILDVLNEYTESKSDKEIETSDKNVANIEDDVKIVKRYLENSAYKESNSDFFKNCD